MQRHRHRIAIAWFPYHDHPWRSRSRSGFGQPTATQLSVRHRASQRRSLRRSRAFGVSVSPTVLGAGQPFVQLRPAPTSRGVAHRDGHRLLLAHQHHQPLAARDPGVEEVPRAQERRQMFLRPPRPPRSPTPVLSPPRAAADGASRWHLAERGCAARLEASIRRPAARNVGRSRARRSRASQPTPFRYLGCRR